LYRLITGIVIFLPRRNLAQNRDRIKFDQDHLNILQGLFILKKFYEKVIFIPYQIYFGSKRAARDMVFKRDGQGK